MTRNRIILAEEIARAIMLADNCGCSFRGERVFCCDSRLPDDARRAEPCECQNMAEAVLPFVSRARQEALEEAEYRAVVALKDTLSFHDSGAVAMADTEEQVRTVIRNLSGSIPEGGEGFQAGVAKWMQACFGSEISADKVERNHRFLEEALELVQALGCTASEAHQLVDYTFGRAIGDPSQEVGGVMVTLAALCLANGLDMETAAETELARIWTKVEQIRAKQAAKPKHSPLPEATPNPVLPALKEALELAEDARPILDAVLEDREQTNGEEDEILRDLIERNLLLAEKMEEAIRSIGGGV
jgi:hypothetical protein